MWLLDVNIPIALKDVLNELGIQNNTVQECGWREFENGQLVSQATTAGFKGLLTRDKNFGKSAAAALKKFQEFSVVIVQIRQMREEAAQNKQKKPPILRIDGFF